MVLREVVYHYEDNGRRFELRVSGGITETRAVRAFRVINLKGKDMDFACGAYRTLIEAMTALKALV